MVDIEFKWNGKTVRADQLGALVANSLEEAILTELKDSVTETIRSIVDPETGEQPRVTIIGSSIDDLSLNIEGSEALVERVKNALS